MHSLRLKDIFLLASIIQTFSVNTHNGGFCDDSARKSIDFPLNPPERHIPWIWDAVVSNRNKIVEVTMVSRNACKFDKKMWKTIVVMFPEYKEQLGNGTEDNILVKTDPFYDYVRHNDKLSGELGRGIQGFYVFCVYIYSGRIVARVKSRKILDVEIAELSTIQIRCPFPDDSVQWEEMRIERILSDSEERLLANSTESFKVCPDPFDMGDDEKKTIYKYDLSVCTATARSSRANLVEWIEYHRLVGVGHFFIYDTNPLNTDVDDLLASTLKDYIESDVVTVVRWPYENCVKNMGSGRWVNVLIPAGNESGILPDKERNVFFQPPRAVSQTGALASCFSRYKSSSRWMAHMDDDEFLAFNPSKKFGHRKAKNLWHLADLLSDKDPRINALYFLPLCVDDCTKVTVARDLAFFEGSRVLPRYRKWNKGRFCPAWEGKLIMRTAAIGMFFTHYITLRESGLWNRNPLELSREDAAVIHFKIANELSGSVYGARLPIQRTEFPILECKRPKNLKFGLNASAILDHFTALLTPHVERRYIAQLSENRQKASFIT